MVNSAVQRVPLRISLTEFLSHPWMRGDVVTKAEFQEVCQDFFDKAAAKKKAEKVSISPSGRVKRSAGSVTFDDDWLDKHEFEQAPE